jgi:FAD/FMN-containing dehydrogenase
MPRPPDLYKVLKGGGGGGNFGIATQFDIAAIPAVGIFACIRLLDPDYSDKVVDAPVAFGHNPDSAEMTPWSVS